ncbi:sensor histidine kinase [Verrucomicrobium spinosum]|uniref:sensor histidine kinase n=1 Tax=Verrucomicrobium spinosum TaxID=2736 RepID=UPI0012F66EF6|nr:HAMP domain-containing sensor histidine kinase [Verrucomicrobium spinosum]
MTVPPKTMELLVVSAANGAEVTTQVAVAGRAVFGEAAVREVGGGGNLLEEPAVHHAQMVVLVDPDTGTVRAAGSALDSQQLPRWAVIVLDNSELISSGAGLARALGDAWKIYQAERECARLRGDLKAVARRVNHDLRSPLGGITTTAELIKELLGESNAELAALTDPLFDSAQSMIRLMDRISFMARAVADPPSGALVAMTEVVWAAEQRLQRQLMRKKITIRRPASWPEVSGVAAWLEVVWLNLMSNAIEHSVAETEVQLFWELAGTRAVRFGVRDTGKGVPPAKRSQLFYPFHLLQQPNSPHGLGLPIVQRLVEMQGGEVACDFPETGGSVFSFTLPV